MNKLAILIIEDQPDIAQSLHDCLTDNDYHVVGIATTYKEAVSLFFSQTIDLVLIDIFWETTLKDSHLPRPLLPSPMPKNLLFFNLFKRSLHF